jgi:hypothetical protein
MAPPKILSNGLWSLWPKNVPARPSKLRQRKYRPETWSDTPVLAPYREFQAGDAVNAEKVTWPRRGRDRGEDIPFPPQKSPQIHSHH